MRGITYNGKHSYKDFGLTISDKNIGNPFKIKTKERVPFSNQIYDFSGIYGGQEYDERPLTYSFNIAARQHNTKENFNLQKIAVLNWLMEPNKKQMLIDDAIPGFYFLAEIESGPDVNEWAYYGTLNVNFTAYPFKIGELEEGNDLWDPFNFELDAFQETEFHVDGRRDVVLYNAGANVVHPTIRTSSSMQITMDGITYNVPAGETEPGRFFLNQGENPMTLIGSGTISFHFHKELI